jgi:hypothetical protein
MPADRRELNDPAIINYGVRLQRLTACEISMTSGVGTFICLGCDNHYEAYYSELFISSNLFSTLRQLCRCEEQKFSGLMPYVSIRMASSELSIQFSLHFVSLLVKRM